MTLLRVDLLTLPLRSSSGLAVTLRPSPIPTAKLVGCSMPATTTHQRADDSGDIQMLRVTITILVKGMIELTCPRPALSQLPVSCAHLKSDSSQHR
jgi:hypothetical protein